ncbi:hypothetical protein HDU67_003600 [Dinochytrium kinnereticum]|nr:hypothetical protein HDU67_003600 [Dinochytrium kinnereticum]
MRFNSHGVVLQRVRSTLDFRKVLRVPITYQPRYCLSRFGFILTEFNSGAMDWFQSYFASIFWVGNLAGRFTMTGLDFTGRLVWDRALLGVKVSLMPFRLGYRMPQSLADVVESVALSVLDVGTLAMIKGIDVIIGALDRNPKLFTTLLSPPLFDRIMRASKSADQAFDSNPIPSTSKSSSSSVAPTPTESQSPPNPPARYLNDCESGGEYLTASQSTPLIAADSQTSETFEDFIDSGLEIEEDAQAGARLVTTKASSYSKPGSD